MKPSTTVRAISSRLLMRASTTGSRKVAPDSAWAALVTQASPLTTGTDRAPAPAPAPKSSARPASHPRTRHRHELQQLIDDLVRRHALRLRVEVLQDAVAQHRVRERTDVVEAHAVPAIHQRARLGGEDHV